MTGTTTYALLAVPFLGVAVLVAVLAGVVSARRRRAGRPGGVPAPRARSAVFNNVIVGLGIVAYDPALVLGARVGLFPVEDLAYSVGAVLLLPSCWVLLDGSGSGSGSGPGVGSGSDRVGRPAVRRPVRSDRQTEAAPTATSATQPSRTPEETP